MAAGLPIKGNGGATAYGIASALIGFFKIIVVCQTECQGAGKRAVCLVAAKPLLGGNADGFIGGTGLLDVGCQLIQHGFQLPLIFALDNEQAMIRTPCRGHSQ